MHSDRTVAISYRREDTAYLAYAIKHALMSKGSQVFTDLEILPGDDFTRAVKRAIAEASVVLVLIGPRWLSSSESGRLRIDNPSDVIRVQVETALRLGKIIIPILADAEMPPADALPLAIRPLLDRQALLLRKDSDFEVYLRRIVATVDAFLPRRAGAATHAETPSETYYSCFISYSRPDEAFCRRLVAKLRDGGIRVWFADEDMKGGIKLVQQIYNAISRHDRLLLVLSEKSLKSDWVAKEIKRARRREKNEGRTILFPIRLCSMDALENWELMDGSEDLASEIREYFIIDFSRWADVDEFDSAFTVLQKSLRTAAGRDMNE